MALPKHIPDSEIPEPDAWVLSGEQMLFMLQHQDAIEHAFAANDLDFLRELAESSAFKSAFGDMGFDEAYDRYETMLEAGDAAKMAAQF